MNASDPVGSINAVNSSESVLAMLIVKYLKCSIREDVIIELEEWD